jgi:hypothetical protein
MYLPALWKMLSCLGFCQSGAKVAPACSSGPPAEVLATPEPPAEALVNAEAPAPGSSCLQAAAPLSDLSSPDCALALAAALALRQRTGGPEELEVRQRLLGEEGYERVCAEEVDAGAAGALLTCLCTHVGSASVYEAAAHCVRNLCAAGQRREAHRTALFPAFRLLAAAATSFCAGSDSAEDAAWAALGNLSLTCTLRECEEALQYAPAAVAALSARAARQEYSLAANFLLYLSHSVGRATGPEDDLRQRTHAAFAPCLTLLLDHVHSDCARTCSRAAETLVELLRARASDCFFSPCAHCSSLSKPILLQAVAGALLRHSADSSACENLAGLLDGMCWESCDSISDVQRAAEALLLCLAKKEHSSHAPFFINAACALGSLAHGRHWWLYRDNVFDPAFRLLLAALTGTCAGDECAAAILCHALGDLTLFCSAPQLSVAVTAVPAVAATLQTFCNSSESVRRWAAHFFEGLLSSAAKHKGPNESIPPVYTRHCSIYISARTAVLSHLPFLLRTLESRETERTYLVNLLATVLEESCGLNPSCSCCEAFEAACLSSLPAVVAALEDASRYGCTVHCHRRGAAAAWVLLKLASRHRLQQHSTFGIALAPLVALIAAQAGQAGSDSSLWAGMQDVLNAAACALLRLVGLPGALTELRDTHLPELVAAADTLAVQPPASLLRLLKELGAGSRVLLHLTPAQTAERLASCLECWRASPRRACPGSASDTHAEPHECPICRAVEPAGEQAALLALSCGHVFHRTCMLEWVAFKVRQLAAAHGGGGGGAVGGAVCCPLDRQPVTRLARAADAGSEGCTLIGLQAAAVEDSDVLEQAAQQAAAEEDSGTESE